jgi:hypothetical protein
MPSPRRQRPPYQGSLASCRSPSAPRPAVAPATIPRCPLTAVLPLPLPRGAGAGGRGVGALRALHEASSGARIRSSTSPRFFWGRCEPKRAEGALAQALPRRTKVRVSPPLTDRDQVDDVHRQASALHRRHPASSKKPRCRPLAGSSLTTKDLWHPARSVRSATGRRTRIYPSRPAVHGSRSRTSSGRWSDASLASTRASRQRASPVRYR